jgi:hypothetical protein
MHLYLPDAGYIMNNVARQKNVQQILRALQNIESGALLSVHWSNCQSLHAYGEYDSHDDEALVIHDIKDGSTRVPLGLINILETVR